MRKLLHRAARDVESLLGQHVLTKKGNQRNIISRILQRNYNVAAAKSILDNVDATKLIKYPCCNGEP